MNFADELRAVAEALEAALKVRDLPAFYRVFRATSLPFLCSELGDNTEALFLRCFDVVHRLGSISPAVALAVENHYYVTSAVATFPAAADSALEDFRQRLMARVAGERLLVANTNSKVHGKKIGAIGTVAVREGTGFRISGEAAYASLATEADILVLLTELAGEGLALFVIPDMVGNPSLEIGDNLFPTAMIDSDTRRIRFNDLILKAEDFATTAESGVAALLLPFEMAWHQALIGALYLGSAARAIEEIRCFANETVGRDNRPLSELDGMIVDVGRLVAEYEISRATVLQCAKQLSMVSDLPGHTTELQRASAAASIAKYGSCRTAEAIVSAARRIVGARSFATGSILERLSSEVIFGTLGPEVTAVIERRLGAQTMQSDRFYGLS